MKAATGREMVVFHQGALRLQHPNYIYIYIPGTQPTHFLGGLTFNFMGQIFQNMGHLGSRYIYLLDMACIHSGIN